MSFISNGDYNFPFDVQFYWEKLVYVWSYQTGSANPDGIIRAPARFLDLVVFALMGNISISIFYLFTCFAIVFLAFYCYSRYFLKISSIWLSLASSLVFAINPIFLGNVSKVGLVLAAAMLPLCLVVVQKLFEKEQFRYLLLWVALLNISLIHPFTFTVNLLVSGGYLLYMSYRNKPLLFQNIPKILLVGLTALLLNAYFLLPLANIGSVNKDVLSANVSSTPTDYTTLINVANTGDIFTGLSLAKGVLKDYEFYNESSQAFYFIGIFTFYVILFGVYVRVGKNLSIAHRKYFTWSLAAFLVLLLLAAVNYFFVKDLIQLIVGLPGGWIFRSPLKWQLYIPFAIATMLAIALAYVPKRSHNVLIYSGLAVSFLCMNGFISIDIYHKLLTPRQITTFSALHQKDLEQKNVLIVNDEACFSYASEHSDVMTELNQILISKNVQVKQMSLADADTVNLSVYDYVLGCQDTAASSLQNYDFNQQHTFANNAFQLYENTKPNAYVYANQRVFALDEPRHVGNMYNFVTDTLGSDFDFIDTPDRSIATTFGLQDAYENVSFEDMHGSSIDANLLPPTQTSQQSLYLKNTDGLFYKLANHRLTLTPEQRPGYQPLSAETENKGIAIPHENNLAVTYSDSRYDSKNIFPNPSLERGLWQKRVSDCYDYDGAGKIKMQANTRDKTNGSQSLQLESETHLACSGPRDIPISGKQDYLLSFDYKSINGRFAAYYVSFDDDKNTSFLKHLDDTNGNWETVTKSIKAPAGARHLKILLYAYPDTSGVGSGIARYDNFRLAATPSLQDHFYLVSTPKELLSQPKKLSYTVINPTKSIIHIDGARSKFYLETKESYSPKWSLALHDDNAKSWWPFAQRVTVPEGNHVKINNFMNGWLVDPNALCHSTCTKNADGSYDITLVMEFVPQRWLYLGAAISMLTLLAVVSYFIYDKRRNPHSTKYILRQK